MLFSLGGLFSIYEGLHKLENPEPLNQMRVALAILALAVVLESMAMFAALREIRHIRGKLPIGQWLKSTRNAERVAVLGEDFAALTGLSFALFFLGLAAYTGDPVYAAIGSICIGVVLIFVSIFVGWRIRDLIIGKSAEPALQAKISQLIAVDPFIERIFNIITIQIGPRVMLAAKVKIRADQSIAEAVTNINKLERRLKQNHPEIAWSFIEPDLDD
jgi:divalent metal cation (Fe/Co/Zn/Cd) transporter